MLSTVLLTKEQREAVGCLALEATNLESVIDVLVAEVCGTDVAEVLLEQKMMKAKLRILRRLLLPGADEGQRREFEDLYARISNDIELRNTAIPGEWSSGKNMTLREMLSMLVYESGDAIATRKGRRASIAAKDVMDLAERFYRYQRELIQVSVSISERSSQGMAGDGAHGSNDAP